jgi:hypothetical protein
MLCNGVQEARRQERETCATFPHDLREPSDATGFQQTSPEKTLLSEKSSLASLALPQKNTSARTTHSGWLLFTQE